MRMTFVEFVDVSFLQLKQEKTTAPRVLVLCCYRYSKFLFTAT